MTEAKDCKMCVHSELCRANCMNNYTWEDAEMISCEGCRSITCPNNSATCLYYMPDNPGMLEGGKE